MRILRESYPDFGPTLAAEKLAARHHLVLSKETVRRVQIAAGLWVPRKLRTPKVQSAPSPSYVRGGTRADRWLRAPLV